MEREPIYPKREQKYSGGNGTNFEFVHRAHDILTNGYQPSALGFDSDSVRAFVGLHKELRSSAYDVQRLSRLTSVLEPWRMNNFWRKAMAYLCYCVGSSEPNKILYVFDKQIERVGTMREILDKVLERAEQDRKGLEEKTILYISRHEDFSRKCFEAEPVVEEEAKKFLAIKGALERSNPRESDYFDLEKRMREQERTLDIAKGKFILLSETSEFYHHAKEGRYIAEKLHRALIAHGRRIHQQSGHYQITLQDTRDLFASTQEISAIAKILGKSLQEIERAYYPLVQLFVEDGTRTIGLTERDTGVELVAATNSELGQLLQQVRETEMRDLKRIDEQFKRTYGPRKKELSSETG